MREVWQHYKRKAKRQAKGSSLVETMSGFFVFIPLAFFAVDIATIANAAQINEQFAESVARIAGTQINENSAIKAGTDVMNNYNKPPLITDVSVDNIDYQLAAGQVTVNTAMSVNLPIPFPGYNQVTVRANAMQPIVCMPAPM